MTATLKRRLGTIERRTGIGTGPLAHFSDADLLAAIEWVAATLGAAGSQTLARADEEEAKLRAFYARPDVTCRFDLEEGWRWPYRRARALWHERRYGSDGSRSAATPEELQAKIEAALTAVQRAS